MTAFFAKGRSRIPGGDPVLFLARDSGGGANIATFAGMVVEIEVWEQILIACDRVLVVMDSQIKRMPENLYYLAYLQQQLRPGIPGCFCLSKTDLPATMPPSEARLHLGLRRAFPDWPIFSSTHESADTQLAPFDYLTGLSL